MHKKIRVGLRHNDEAHLQRCCWVTNRGVARNHYRGLVFGGVHIILSYFQLFYDLIKMMHIFKNVVKTMLYSLGLYEIILITMTVIRIDEIYLSIYNTIIYNFCWLIELKC